MLYELFAEQARIHPQRIAIKHDDLIVSYKELEEMTLIFCNALFAKGLPTNQPIILAIPPSISFIIAVLASMRLGQTYIPVELSQPDTYLKQIISDAQPAYIITTPENEERFNTFNKAEVININGLNSLNHKNILPSAKNTRAYIIYTSGSTGKPKGVLIEAEGLKHLMSETREIYQMNYQDKIPLFHSLGFDVSVWEMCAALFNGASLVIVPEMVKKSPQDYVDFLVKNEITILNLTPSYFYLWYLNLLKLNNEKNEYLARLKLRLILLAGEPFHAKKIKEWFNLEIAKKVKIYNMYGITEGTIHSMCISISEEMKEMDASLIGKPLPHVKLCVVNQEGGEVNKGEIGELYLSGSSISLGYLNQPQLTSQRFVNVELGQEGVKRWLKTGDLVKWGEYGLEYIGRKDLLTKIRGFRVNIGDVEAAISAVSYVKGVAVIPYTASDLQPRLAAFILSQNKEIDLTLLKEKISTELPEYMCPTKFIAVPTFPLNQNGKIDIPKLISTYIEKSESLESNYSNLTMIEKIKLAWKKVLTVDEINPENNFFDAGGDSLLLVKLQYELELQLNRKVKILDLVKYPSINKFYEYIIK